MCILKVCFKAFCLVFGYQPSSSAFGYPLELVLTFIIITLFPQLVRLVFISVLKFISPSESS